MWVECGLDLPSTKFTIPPANSTTDWIEDVMSAKTDSTLWKSVSKIERMVAKIEERREEKESVMPAMMLLYGSFEGFCKCV